MDTIEQLIAEGIIVSKDFTDIVTIEDIDTGKVRRERVIKKRYYDTRQFIKTFNPIIDKLVKDFVGDPKAQFIFILMSILEENINNVDVNLGYAEFSKICDKHRVKHWTRAQLSNCLKWMSERNYIAKVDGSIYRINYRYFYNGNILKPLGLTGPIEQIREEIQDEEL